VACGAGDVWVSSPSASSIPPTLSVVWGIGRGSRSFPLGSKPACRAGLCVHPCAGNQLEEGFESSAQTVLSAGRRWCGESCCPPGGLRQEVLRLNYRRASHSAACSRAALAPRALPGSIGLSFPAFVLLAPWNLGAVPRAGTS